MKLRVSWDSSVTSSLFGAALTNFESAVDYVANLFDTTFTDPVTVTIGGQPATVDFAGALAIKAAVRAA